MFLHAKFKLQVLHGRYLHGGKVGMMENEGFRRAISLSSIFSSRGRYGSMKFIQGMSTFKISSFLSTYSSTYT